ncbi:hypothetical protein MNBD_BACTEROID07-1481, partial [hydrothermal vent metagenome]
MNKEKFINSLIEYQAKVGVQISYNDCIGPLYLKVFSYKSKVKYAYDFIK